MAENKLANRGLILVPIITAITVAFFTEIH